MIDNAARRRRTNSQDSLSRYLAEIRAYPLLSRDDEVELTRRIRLGDEEALQQLVCGNLRFVVSVAKKYRNRGLPLSDLINEGNVGLMRAASKFDEGRGVRFLSYAGWWIREAMVQAILNQGQTIRVPVRGAPPTICLSLDAPASEESVVPLIDILPPDEPTAFDQTLDDPRLKESVHAALSLLESREARVVRLYFGFDDDEPKSLEHIGTVFGITRERARQIKDRALQRILRTGGATLAAFAS